MNGLAPITQLLVFSSTPDVEGDGFVVPVLAAPIEALGWKAREHGFDGLEFLPNPDDIPDAAALRSAADASGITVGVINTGRLRPKGYAILHADPAQRRRSLDAFKRCIDLAGALGARVGLGMARGDAAATASRDLRSVMRDVFGEVAEHAVARGTVVMLEPADPGYVAAILRVSEAAAAAREVASPGFRIMLDTYQLDQVEGSIDDGFAHARGMAGHIHLYDPEHWPPGLRAPEHRLDWNEIRRMMLRHGFLGSGSTVLPKQGDLLAQSRIASAFIRTNLMRESDRSASVARGEPASARAIGGFSGMRAIVTGGGSGIGMEVAKALAREGARVVVADLSAEHAEAVAATIRASGGAAEACTVDVADEGSVKALMEAGGDGMDVLVCAAGLFLGGSAPETSIEDWHKVIDINLTGTFLCAKAAVAQMRKKGGGSIVLLSSSTGAHDAIGGAVAYVASKGGVTLLTKALAVDHAAEGIRVNAVAPGPTDTPMLRGLLDEAGLRAFAATLPVGRLGAPEEIASVAVFLASPAARFVTGAIVAADGGQTALV